MEQRKTIDGRIELIEPVDLSKAPGGMDLIAVGEANKLRAAGRAAGVKQGADGVAVRRELEIEGGALRREAFLEARDLAIGIASATDHQNPLQRRHAADDRIGLFPQSR